MIAKLKLQAELQAIHKFDKKIYSRSEVSL